MSVQDYMALQKQSVEASKTIGCVLPMVREGELVVDSQRMTASELKALVQSEGVATGWQMGSSKTDTFKDMPLSQLNVDTLIEAEWIAGQKSVRVKLLSPNRYVFSCFGMGTQSTHAYRDTSFLLRSNIDAVSCTHALYRHWWQLKGDGSWQPLAQVFMGFSNEDSKSMEA